MESRLSFDILPQPNDTTCGPTCLHAVYRYFGDSLPLEQVIQEVPALEQGGTLAVLLGCHALRRGYEATIYTYNLQVFDPTWFTLPSDKIADKLREQMQVKESLRLRQASGAYIDFLGLGGKIRMADLNAGLIRRYLLREVPVLTGLSSTFLYREPRTVGHSNQADDVLGVPAGHFVVLCGYEPHDRQVLVADPLFPNPFAEDHFYVVQLDRVVNAILLGILTYDANLLILRPRKHEHSRNP